MKNKLHNDNYEEVMFGLLEQQYSDEEKEEILFEIERDPLMAFEWKQFQKCVLTEDIKPYEIQEVEFWKSLHKKEESPVIIKRYYFNDYFGIAASVLLILSFTLMLYFQKNSKSGMQPEGIVSIPPSNPKVVEPIAPTTLKDMPSEKIKLNPSARQHRPAETNTVVNIEKTPENFSIPEPDKLPEQKVAEPDKIVVLKKQPKYAVKIQTGEISETEFAMMQDYDIQNWSKEEEGRINTFLKTKETSIAQLLKNTTLKFKKKDNTIYLLAFGDDQSMFVWEIAK